MYPLDRQMQGWQYGMVWFAITVCYEIFWAKSTVRNYGTIYFPRYGTVRKYDIFFVLFSNLFRTNLIIERRPFRYVSNQDLCHFRHAVSMKYSKLYRVVHIVQKKKRSPNPFPACLSSIGASYRWPSWRAHSQDFGLYKVGFLRGGFLNAENNLSIISVFVDFFLKEARAFLGGGALSPQSTSPSPRLRACFQGDEWVSAWWQARNQNFQRGVLFRGKVDLKSQGGPHLGKKWTVVLYPMEPLPQGGSSTPPPPPGYGPGWFDQSAMDNYHGTVVLRPLGRSVAVSETPPGSGGLGGCPPLYLQNTFFLYTDWLKALHFRHSHGQPRPPPLSKIPGCAPLSKIPRHLWGVLPWILKNSAGSFFPAQKSP